MRRHEKDDGKKDKRNTVVDNDDSLASQEGCNGAIGGENPEDTEQAAGGLKRGTYTGPDMAVSVE